MIRYTVFISLSVVLLEVSAAPYRHREKTFNSFAQDTLSFDQLDGKIKPGMKEVEPPQDLDNMVFDIDPNMLIWKAVKELQPKYDMPEEDKDDIYHSVDFLLPVDFKQSENYMKQLVLHKELKYDTPEEDKDDLYHGVF